MSLSTMLGLFIVTGGATTIGSLPVLFHRYFKEANWECRESFGAGVMISASLFSLFLPALNLATSFVPIISGVVSGVGFIFIMAMAIKKLTENILHQRAYLFVFVMGLHNIPEGLAVGVDVGAMGWKESLPLTIAIFIQNLPEGLASAMSFLISGFSVNKALLANAVTAVIETLSAFLGHSFATSKVIDLPFLMAFSGACMVSVLAREAMIKIRGEEAATFSYPGFGVGLLVCAVLDFVL